jgi:hypothetical protein
MTAPAPLPFVERRTFTAPVLTVGGGILGAVALIVFTELRDGEAVRSFLPYVAGLLVLGAVLIALAGRIPGLAGPGDHLRVDTDGLHVGGDRHLRSERIGEVTIVPSHLAGAYAAQGHVKGDRAEPLRIPPGQSTYAAIGSIGRAVLVEQRPGRAWLLATRRPEELAAALEAARDGARR